MGNQVKCPYCNGLGYTEDQSEFDFNSLYLEYPKKGPGKKRGLLKLKKIVKSQKRYEQIELAIKKLKGLNRETQYYPNFDTFVNNWEDYYELPDTKVYNKPKDPVHEFLEKARLEVEGLNNAG